MHPPDLDDQTPAITAELENLAELINEDSVLWFRDIRDGGSVGGPFGGGPFSAEDEFAVDRSWRLCTRHRMPLPKWKILRKKIWTKCIPWTKGLEALFGCAQDELLSQWRELPSESRVSEIRGLKKIAVPLGKRERSVSDQKRDAIVFTAIRMGLRGRRYCQFLDDNHCDPLLDWMKYGWPESYREAYFKGGKWLVRIHQEKNRAKKRMQQLSDEELKGILALFNQKSL